MLIESHVASPVIGAFYREERSGLVKRIKVDANKAPLNVVLHKEHEVSEKRIKWETFPFSNLSLLALSLPFSSISLWRA